MLFYSFCIFMYIFYFPEGEGQVPTLVDAHDYTISFSYADHHPG